MPDPTRCLLILSLLACAPHSVAFSPADTITVAQASLDELHNSAAQGDAGAMATLGWRYYRGQGVKEDNEQAMRWFRTAMDKGNVSAMFGLSRGLEFGYGVKQDTDAGHRLLIAAATQGDAEAQVAAGQAAFDADNAGEARAWRERAAAQGYPEGLRQYGHMLLHGIGGPVDTERAIPLLRQAAALDDARAMVILGQAYEYGIGLAQDLVQARAWYRRAAEAGDERGHYNFGDVLQRGVGGKSDLDAALRQYRLGAGKGDADSAYALASLYSGDSAAYTDLDEMRRWLARGVQLNDPRAMVWQGNILLSGTLEPSNQAEAVKLYARAADMGNVSGIYYLATCLEDGSGVPQDLPRAAQLYRSIKDKAPDAMQRLVAMQLAGKGMPADAAAAMLMVDAELARSDLVSMLELATFLQERSEDGAADAVRQRVLAHPDAAAARKQLDFVEAWGRLGRAYRGVERLDIAQSTLDEQRAMLDRLPDAGPAAIAGSLLEQGCLYFQRGEPALADAALTRSLSLRESLGANDHALAEHLAWIAACYENANRFAQAERLFRRTLAIVQAQPFTTPDVLARARNRLGYDLYMQGKYEEAAPFFAAAIGGLEAYHHARSPSLAGPLTWLGLSYQALGRDELAAAQFERLVAIRERNSSEEDDRMRATAMERLAGLRTSTKRHAEAEQLLQQAFALYKPRADGRDMGLATLLHRHAELLRDTRRYAAADRAFERALGIMLSLPAAAKWDASGVMHDLGLSLRQQEQPERAATMLARAFAIRLELRPQHHATRQSGDLLAAVYRDIGKLDAALDVARQMTAASATVN
jgi:TPR repeat protein